MSLTKLTTDLENIQALSDTPNSTEGLTADELKALFDKAGTDIKTYINDTLTTEVDSIDAGKVNKTDIVDNLTTNDATKVLSAKQGKVLNDKIIDSGWISASLENGWSNLVTRTTQYRKIGSIVYVRGTITGGTQTATTTLFTLPVGYRVVQSNTKAVCSCYNGSTIVLGYLTLINSGEVKADIDLPTNNEVALYFSFVAD